MRLNTHVPRADSVSQPAIVPAALLRHVSWILLLAYTASSILSLNRLIPADTINRYMAPWYYVDYSDGFIRRGLPGELLRLTWAPSRLSINVLAWVLTLAGALALVVIALRIASLARPGSRLITATLVLLAPLGITTVIRDPGRLEAVGMVVMAAFVLIATKKSLPPAVVVFVVALGTALAVACEEFLLAFMAPVAASLVYVMERRRSPAAAQGLGKRYARPVAISLLPGIALAVASLAAKPSSAYLDDLVRRSTPKHFLSPVWELRHSLPWLAEWTWSHRGVGNILATTSIWLLIYLATIIAVRILIGNVGTWYWISATYFGLAAAASLLTTDYRRWWTLALVSHLAVVGILSSGDQAPRHETSAWIRRVGRYAVPLALLVSLYGQSLPNTVRPARDGWGGLSGYIGPEYGKLIVPFWLRGKEQN